MLVFHAIMCCMTCDQQVEALLSCLYVCTAALASQSDLPQIPGNINESDVPHSGQGSFLDLSSGVVLVNIIFIWLLLTLHMLPK